MKRITYMTYYSDVFHQFLHKVMKLLFLSNYYSLFLIQMMICLDIFHWLQKERGVKNLCWFILYITLAFFLKFSLEII